MEIKLRRGSYMFIVALIDKATSSDWGYRVRKNGLKIKFNVGTFCLQLSVL
jgi:hypothetical protein